MHVVRWLAEAAAWAVIAVTVGLLATQVAGWSRSMLVAVGQALTTVLGGLSVLVAIAGRVWSDWPLTIAGLVAAAGTVPVVVPAMRHRTTLAPAPALTVLHANVLFKNTTRAAALAAVVLGQDVDVVALSEVHPAHEQALRDDPRAAEYPHRLTRAATDAGGLALWSRHPLADVDWLTDDLRPTVIATVCLPDGAVRVVLAHNHPPTTPHGLHSWEPSMVSIHTVASSAGPPTLIVADLNAARWHPPLRRLLGRGWRDAHEAAGRGLSVSWRTDGRLPIPFVRLDHALLDDRLTVASVRDLAIPGSDHRGFVVGVAPTSPTRPLDPSSSRPER